MLVGYNPCKVDSQLLGKKTRTSHKHHKLNLEVDACKIASQLPKRRGLLHYRLG
jgi:hypothetical protein